MEKGTDRFLIAPFAVWMALLFVLPSAPWAYAVRTVVTGAVLVWSAVNLRAAACRVPGIRSAGTSLAWGALAGLLVLFIWVWPEKAFGWYRTFCMYGYTANAPVDASAWHWKAIRLLGSAFVISVAEELFFRKWLMRFAGFGWMVVLFAVQHNRPVVAAITGVIYGLLALRKGLLSAIVAHVVTNLALGVYVLLSGDWSFW